MAEMPITKVRLLSEKHGNSFNICFMREHSEMKRQETWNAACLGMMTMDSYREGELDKLDKWRNNLTVITEERNEQGLFLDSSLYPQLQR